MATAQEVFWERMPLLSTLAEVADAIRMKSAAVSTALKNGRLAGYHLNRVWLISKQDLRGFLANDSRAKKLDAALLVDQSPEPTDEVAPFAKTLPERLALDDAARLLRMSPAALARVAAIGGARSASTDGVSHVVWFPITDDGHVLRADLIEYLRYCINRGQRYK